MLFLLNCIVTMKVWKVKIWLVTLSGGQMGKMTHDSCRVLSIYNETDIFYSGDSSQRQRSRSATS